MKKIIFTAILAISFVSFAFCASKVEVTAVTDRTTAKLGDVIRYTLSIKRQGDLSQSPSLSLPAFEGFRTVGNYSSNSMSIINGTAAAQTDQAIDLMAVKSGVVTINPAKVKFYNPDTKQYENIETKPITIKVSQGGSRMAVAATAAAPAVPTALPAPQATPDIREIKMSISMSFMDLLPYIILALLFIALVYFGWKKLTNKKAAKPAAAVQGDSYKQEAADMLEKSRGLLKSGDVKQYYYAMYEAVRFYISKKYNGTFGELTTQEIVRKLSDLKAGEPFIKPVYEFMKDCDLVKFADYKPSEKETEEAYEKAKIIING
jgi:hypothetical protein